MAKPDKRSDTPNPTEQQQEEGQQGQSTDKQQRPIVIIGFVPGMTLERYAELSGLTNKTASRQADRRYIPTYKQGRRRMVNIAKMTEDLINEG